LKAQSIKLKKRKSLQHKQLATHPNCSTLVIRQEFVLLMKYGKNSLAVHGQGK